jgi:hypothetical protein
MGDDGLGRKKFRTSGNAVVVLTALSVAACALSQMEDGLMCTDCLRKSQQARRRSDITRFGYAEGRSP